MSRQILGAVVVMIWLVVVVVVVEMRKQKVGQNY
jgi:hypothetical protein